MKRYTIDVIGTAEADVTELFPNPSDPENPTLEQLLAVLKRVDPWETVMHGWAYGDDFTMVITDTVTGQSVEYNTLRREWAQAVSA